MRRWPRGRLRQSQSTFRRWVPAGGRGAVLALTVRCAGTARHGHRRACPVAGARPRRYRAADRHRGGAAQRRPGRGLRFLRMGRQEADGGQGPRSGREISCRALVFDRLPGALHAGCSHAADEPVDPGLLEFLGSVDTEDKDWHEYLARTDIDQVAKRRRQRARPTRVRLRRRDPPPAAIASGQAIRRRAHLRHSNRPVNQNMQRRRVPWLTALLLATAASQWRPRRLVPANQPGTACGAARQLVVVVAGSSSSCSRVSRAVGQPAAAASAGA